MIVNSNNDQDWCWLPPWLSDYRHNSGGRRARAQSLWLTPPRCGETGGDLGDGVEWTVGWCHSVSQCGVAVVVLLPFWRWWWCHSPACCNSISAPPIEAVVAGGLAGTSLSPPACMAPADTLLISGQSSPTSSPVSGLTSPLFQTVSS